jgi:hypothetical protein
VSSKVKSSRQHNKTLQEKVAAIPNMSLKINKNVNNTFNLGPQGNNTTVGHPRDDSNVPGTKLPHLNGFITQMNKDNDIIGKINIKGNVFAPNKDKKTHVNNENINIEKNQTTRAQAQQIQNGNCKLGVSRSQERPLENPKPVKP